MEEKPALSGKIHTMETQVMRGVRLTGKAEIAENVFILDFPGDFDFLPGQVLSVATEEFGPRRLYSLCSGITEKKASILFNLIEEGYLTPRLTDLNPGDSIWISSPRGEFISDSSPAVWIATGTGIAPFHSMLRSGLGINKTLIHGERSPDRFYFSEAFRKKMGNDYIACCSGEPAPGLFHGRVTGFLENWEVLQTNVKYYLCGRAEMVVEVRDMLIAKGVPFHNILSEIYF